MSKSKAVGLLLLLYGSVCFLVNLGIWQPLFIGNLHILWNPIDAVITNRWIGTPPFIGDIGNWLLTGWILNYIFALFYSGIVGVASLVLLLH